MSSLSAITRLSSIAFMFGSSDVAPPKRGEYTGHYPCSEAADGMILDRKLQKYERTSPCNAGRLSTLGARPIQIRARSPEMQLAAAARSREKIGRRRAPRESKILARRRARRRLHEHTGAPIYKNPSPSPGARR